jgi:hypothetical protein
MGECRAIKMRKSFLIKTFFVTALLSGFAFGGQQQYWNEGLNSANSILGDIKSNMNKRINNPVANGSDLYTYDNSSHKKVSLMCSQEYNIMQISYSVESGGDIDLKVKEDLNLDNSYEKKFETLGISGICANGIIKCDSGTWDNCKYYSISFNGSKLIFTKTFPGDLSGCYCINNSCGAISSNSKAKILSDVGGMLAQVIRDKYYVVSNVMVDGDYAYVKGKSINCNGENVPLGMDADTLEEKTEEAKKQGIKNTQSTYYLLNQTTENVNNNPIDENFKKNLKNKHSSIKSSVKWNEKNNQYSYGKIKGTMFVKNPDKIFYCEIEYIQSSPDAFYDNTNRVNSTSSDKIKKTKIIECIKNQNKWICPVKKGEKVKYGCGKIDDFGEVAGALSSINEAAKDLTCSTN